MRRNKLVILGMCAILSMASLSACSKKVDNKAVETTTEVSESQNTEESKEATDKKEEVKEEKFDKKAPKKYGKVTLPNLSDLEISILDTKVSDVDVDFEIENTLASSEQTKEVTDRAVQNGDIANIDFVGKKDGVEFEGGKAQGYDLTIGSGQFVPGFEEQLVGLKIGETKSIDITFPKNYASKELAGQAVVFDVTINKISEKEEAKLTDEWVQKTTKGQSQTVAQFKEYVKNQLEKQKKNQSDMMGIDNTLSKLLEASTFDEINEEAINYEYEKAMFMMKSRIKMYGQNSIEDYVKTMGITIEDFEKQMKEQAETIVKHKIIIDTIAKKDKVKVTKEDYKLLEDVTGRSIEDLKKENSEEIEFYAKAYAVSKDVESKAKVKMLTFEELMAENQKDDVKVEEDQVKKESESEEVIEETTAETKAE